jgi:hypothetical protein
VGLIHAIALSGVRQNEWEGMYNKKVNKFRLGDDYDFIERVHDSWKWVNHPLLDWETANYHLNRANVAQYKIAGEHKWLRPLVVLNGRWTKTEPSPQEKEWFESEQKFTESRFLQLRLQLDKCKDSLLSNARAAGLKQFEKATAILVH